MNKKQAILFIFSMLSIATLILAETTEEKCLRKQIYANQVELIAKDKPLAIKIINNHVEKCKEKLADRQIVEGQIKAHFVVIGTIFALGILPMKLERSLLSLGSCVLGLFLVSNVYSFVDSRYKRIRLETSLNRDIQVFERLKTVRNKNVT